MTKLLPLTTRTILVLATVLFLLGFFLFPGQFFQNLLSNELKVQFQLFYGFGISLLAVGVLTAYFLHETLLESPSLLLNRWCLGLYQFTVTFTRRWGTWACAVLIAYICLRCFFDLNTPFDFDEHEFSGLLTQKILGVINPFRSDGNQAFSLLLSFFSLEVFGPTRFAARLPSFVFAILFLGMFVKQARRSLPPWVLLLCLLHFSANELFLWYTHSMRGYITWVFLGLCTVMLVRDFTVGVPGERRVGTPRAIAFAICVLLCLVSHGLSGVFLISLAVAFTFWLYFNRDHLTRNEIREGAKFIGILAAILPIYGGIGFVLLKELRRSHMAFHMGMWAEANFVAELGLMAGNSFIWGTKAAFITLVLVVLSQLSRLKEFLKDFVVLQVLSYCSLLAVIFFSLKSYIFNARYLLVILPLLLWVVGESIDKLPSAKQKVLLMGLSFISFVCIPLFSRKAVFSHLTVPLLEYQQFVDKTLLVTSPLEKSCFEFSGIGNEIRWAERFYFARRVTGGCQRTFHVAFKESQFSGGEELLRDSEGRRLFRLKNT